MHQESSLHILEKQSSIQGLKGYLSIETEKRENLNILAQISRIYKIAINMNIEVLDGIMKHTEINNFKSATALDEY